MDEETARSWDIPATATPLADIEAIGMESGDMRVRVSGFFDVDAQGEMAEPLRLLFPDMPTLAPGTYHVRIRHNGPAELTRVE